MRKRRKPTDTVSGVTMPRKLKAKWGREKGAKKPTSYEVGFFIVKLACWERPKTRKQVSRKWYRGYPFREICAHKGRLRRPSSAEEKSD